MPEAILLILHFPTSPPSTHLLVSFTFLNPKTAPDEHLPSANPGSFPGILHKTVYPSVFGGVTVFNASSRAVLTIVTLCCWQGTRARATWSKTEWHDPTDWVIANSPWTATGCTASGETEPGGTPTLLRLRPEDLGLGLGSPLSRQQPTSPRADGQATTVMMEQRHAGEESTDDVQHHHQHHHHHHQQQQQQQQHGNHDNGLVIDPLVLEQSDLYYPS